MTSGLTSTPCHLTRELACHVHLVWTCYYDALRRTGPLPCHEVHATGTCRGRHTIDPTRHRRFGRHYLPRPQSILVEFFLDQPSTHDRHILWWIRHRSFFDMTAETSVELQDLPKLSLHCVSSTSVRRQSFLLQRQRADLDHPVPRGREDPLVHPEYFVPVVQEQCSWRGGIVGQESPEVPCVVVVDTPGRLDFDGKEPVR